MKILYLTIKRKWFIEIALGYKTVEYRDVKLHWVQRLVDTANGNFSVDDDEFIGRTYDEVHFRNGYKPDSPFMRVVYLDTKSVTINRMQYFAILLGDILEIKNINLLAYADPWLTELSVNIETKERELKILSKLKAKYEQQKN